MTNYITATSQVIYYGTTTTAYSFRLSSLFSRRSLHVRLAGSPQELLGLLVRNFLQTGCPSCHQT